MLTGTVLYLLEWVAIIAAQVEVPLGADATRNELLAAYDGRENALGWAAGWFSVALLGRILMMIGLRDALRDSGRRQPLMDFAIPAMAVSVGLEIATYAVPAGAAWSLANGADLDLVRGLDAVALVLNSMLWGPLGMAMLCCGVAMLWSGLFPRTLTILALGSGAAATLSSATVLAPDAAGAAGAATTAAALGFWAWMMWTSILVWRATRSRSRSTEAIS